MQKKREGKGWTNFQMPFTTELGKNWDLWNHYMREHFLRTQETEGHAKGSWSPVGSDYGARGGRIYTTSMTLLTLEAYYRHLPLYRKIAKPASN